MKKVFFIVLMLIFSVVLYSCVSTRTEKISAPGPSVIQQEGVGQRSISLDDQLPVDSDVRIGVLENGITYYIRKNSNPEKRAELRLVVNAGSILEDDDQLGLAHFLEHMAFNGTRNFDKQEIVDYLESIGMRFGPDLNAYTTYDETVYVLQVPTDREDALYTAIHILDEWAQYMILDEEEIDMERGVITEEWRVRRSAESRIRDRHAPVLYYNSRYAERKPIGKMEIVQTFKPEVLRRFYKDWYRPDLMAVIAVGDFDPVYVEELIKEHFSEMKQPKNPRPRERYPVPDHRGTLFSIVSDKEATASRISVITKHDPRQAVSVRDYRDLLVESLFHGMLNVRLDELSKKPDAPFIEGYSASGTIVRSKEFYILGARVKDNGIDRGFESLITEAERVKRYGFTPSELERQKNEFLSYIDRIYNERNKIESDRFVSEYVGNYLENETIPGIEYEREIYRKFLPGITLDEVKWLADKWLTDENRVVLASAPEKEGVKIPREEELRNIMLMVKNREIDPYQDLVTELPLIPVPPTSGSIKEETTIEALGITQWVLSNNVRVVLKPTDFKNDEVMFGAYSPGGHSLASDKDWIAARTAADVIIESGVGSFSRIEIEKKLAGKIAEVSPWIDELFEGMNGSSTPGDLETLFQLIYLYFTQPRRDEKAFVAYRERLKGLLGNRESSPEEAFWDAVQSTLSEDHHRTRPMRSEMLVEMDLDGSYNFYRERFSDAGDFIFFFVGNFEPQGIRPFVETYLASLPSTGRGETWRDLGVEPPDRIVEATVKKGIENKSTTAIVFNGDFDWSLKNVFTLNALEEVLDIPLRENLRERQGGTYDVFVYAVPFHYPNPEYRVYIGFSTAPDQVEKLIDLAFDVVRQIQEEGPAEIDVDKVREILRRERETNMRRNEFWLRILRSYYIHGIDPLEILQYDTLLEGLSVRSIQEAAKTYLNLDRYIKVVQYPENWSVISSLLERFNSTTAAVSQDLLSPVAHQSATNGKIIQYYLRGPSEP